MIVGTRTEEDIGTGETRTGRGYRNGRDSSERERQLLVPVGQTGTYAP